MADQEPDFDIIVVGCGCAGAVAAYTAAQAGKSVLVVERGEYSGAKNMTGGRIYSHALKKVFPDFEKEAPVERKVTHERIAMMDPTANMTVDFTSDKLSQEGKDSYTVLRAPFDQWLSSKAEDAGAEIINGIAVEQLIKDDAGRVVGIKAGEDEITASVVIVAEGANNLLTERCLGAKRPTPDEMAVGIKEVFQLPSDQIEQRFLCPKGEGAAMLFVGDCTHGRTGGGFLYTNKDSISLGLVATISQIEKADNPTPIYQMLDDFKHHPAVAPIIDGAKLVEHSGHLVPEGGYNMVPQLVYDGCLVAGDAGMLCMNLGYQVRGMDFAVESGRIAGEVACKAIDAKDTSATGLASYKTQLEQGFVLSDLKTFSAWPETMLDWKRMFTEYPKAVEGIFNAMFVVDGQNQKHLKERIKPIIKEMGTWKTLKEVRGALKAL